ncbi:IS66 family insertion sequence element accessory protein TnpA, partial [Parashewanella curva]|uniref:IS66 family insertion sequence element accessory protein TnpA n=1 Tax=Parashewanella curva TaxID=2338552 RepID=UPI003A5991D9
MRHQHRSPEEWLHLLEEQRDSGLTIGQFCHQKSILIQSFHNAKAKIKRLRKEVEHS